jgi:uncharacterized protein (TIGR03545 family)
MKQLFRWSGLLGFLIVTALLGAFWLLLAGPLVKNAIEYTGSEAIGAEVNLDDAGVGLAPLKLRLGRLQVTDPSQPTHNMVEFQKAEARLDLWKLLLGQVVIDEMSIDGLKFDTERARPGALKAQTAEKGGGQLKERAARALAGAGIELPSVAEVLQKEPLLISQRSDELKRSYSEEQARLEALQARLPDEEQRRDYQQRIQQLTGSKPQNLAEFNQRKQELDKLKAELAGVKQTLSDARQQVQQSRQSLQRKLGQLKAAPGEDWQRLSSKYSLSSGGALNLSSLLFGDKVKRWSGKALYWYELARPYLERSASRDETPAAPQRAAGRYVRFAHRNPTPDFLLREARLQIALPFGEVLGQLNDLTDQPQLLGRPATLKIDAQQLKGAERLVADATFDHTSLDQPRDTLRFQLSALQMDAVQLSTQEALSLQLARALGDLSGDITLRGEAIEAQFSGKFSKAHFSAETGEGLAGEIASALAGIDRFAIDGAIGGTLGAPRVSLSSDLDKRINQQLQQRLRAKQTEFEQKLRSALEARIAGPQEEYRGKLKEWQALQGDLQGQIDAYEKMLQAKLAGVQEKARGEAEGKAKEQLEKGLEGLKF